ncbi:hypothetical protein [Gemmobacter serpentinus]|uniref:hypothetical protein n=1 Tax=Gemmobacter serpentinus TaxID=2652247 RepID=UPI00124DBF39|nr:hypothetical protein [Gemmobacter serpentinus]
MPVSARAPSAPISPDALTPDLARAVAAEGLAHLFRMLRPEGSFIYAHKMDDPEAEIEGYNMLRHCGTLWFMLRAVNVLRLPLLKTEARALRAGVGYAGRRMRAVDWAPGLALVTGGRVKLGGVGLALLMLPEYARAMAPDAAALRAPRLPMDLPDTMAALGTYAFAQQDKADPARFAHMRQAEDGHDEGFHSDYYTGEALFGLIASGADPALTGPVAEALMQQGYGIDVQSHWMSYAAAEACARGLVPQDLGRDYLGALLAAIVTDDSYRNRAESTPIACRSEALAHFLWLDTQAPGRFFTPEQIRDLKRCLRENLALQLRWFRRGQFRRGDAHDKVQIDYIQHNAMAFLAWSMLPG